MVLKGRVELQSRKREGNRGEKWKKTVRDVQERFKNQRRNLKRRFGGEKG